MRLSVLFCLLLFPSLSFAQSPVTVDAAWSVPPVKGMQVGVAYITLTNHSDAPVTLTAISGDVSNSIELHTHIMDKDIMKMRKLDSLAIKPHETVTFAPGGLHLMLIGLKRELAVGDSFPVTLHFGEAKTDTTITVRSRDDASQKESHGHHH